MPNGDLEDERGLAGRIHAESMDEAKENMLVVTNSAFGAERWPSRPAYKPYGESKNYHVVESDEIVA